MRCINRSKGLPSLGLPHQSSLDETVKWCGCAGSMWTCLALGTVVQCEMCWMNWIYVLQVFCVSLLDSWDHKCFSLCFAEHILLIDRLVQHLFSANVRVRLLLWCCCAVLKNNLKGADRLRQSCHLQLLLVCCVIWCCLELWARGRMYDFFLIKKSK